ncbi:MAG TPA: methylenetetrahydrofolate reductase [NAD(P)H] [Mycobacteriales bacterium]|jgi:methylenetetrahydrofolate reductase (NADPH)|nr:methylenetetrahydrofolate reductase [NAD(P)H] [Mycobacteriales bacterium]
MSLGLTSVLPQRRPSVAELISRPEPTFSFEFFPPKTDAGEAVLWQAIRELEPLQPSFVSITYGAGGSSRDRTIGLTGRIAAQTTLLPMAHLTAVNHSIAELRNVIGYYAEVGVRDILALRGDPPGNPGGEWIAHPEGLNYAAELVELVSTSGSFCVGVAAFPDIHPRSDSLESDVACLVAKARAGAAFAITQFFFDWQSYTRLRDAVAATGCDMPIVPGVMPVTNVSQIERMAVLSGTPFPDDLARRLHAVADYPAVVRAIGVEVATVLSRRLLDEGAPGVHFITLNRSTATREVWAQLHSGPVIQQPGSAKR